MKVRIEILTFECCATCEYRRWAFVVDENGVLNIVGKIEKDFSEAPACLFTTIGVLFNFCQDDTFS